MSDEPEPTTSSRLPKLNSGMYPLLENPENSPQSLPKNTFDQTYQSFPIIPTISQQFFGSIKSHKNL